MALFQEAATKQAEATENGDYKTANKNYDKIIDIMDYLKRENSVDRLHDFLSAPSVGIRIWAASYLLPTHEKESVKVLQEIEKGEGIHSLTAETTLSQWRIGNLKFK